MRSGESRRSSPLCTPAHSGQPGGSPAENRSALPSESCGVARWQIIRDHIAAKNVGLAHMISRKFRLGAVDEDDLLSEGMCALGRAIDRFNPWRGFRFSTYACNVVRRALLRRSKGELPVP